MNITDSTYQTQQIYNAKLTDKQFSILSRFVYENFGIKMPEVKKTMLQSRLHKRLRDLKMFNFDEYIDYLFSKKGMANEVILMINEVSTNKTDFFREPIHFSFINDQILPNRDVLGLRHQPMSVWSAGCSSGEEPFTIAMILEDFARNNPGFQYRLLATDISTNVLKLAQAAVYKEDRITPIPMDFRKKYLLKGKNELQGYVRIIPELRRKVQFSRLNFMDAAYQIQDEFNIIFCRNVLIYFEQKTQEKIINKLCRNLRTGGIFFLGHSESITNMNVPLKQLKPTIFQKV